MNCVASSIAIIACGGGQSAVGVLIFAVFQTIVIGSAWAIFVFLRRRRSQALGIIVAISIVVFIEAFVVPGLAAARNKARAASSHCQLKQIGLGLRLYCDDNRNFYPPTLDSLVTNYLTKRYMLVDVLSGKKFVYLAAGRRESELSPDDCLVYTPRNPWGGNALFNDGHVQGFGLQSFAEFLAELARKTNQPVRSAPEISVRAID